MSGTAGPRAETSPGTSVSSPMLGVHPLPPPLWPLLPGNKGPLLRPEAAPAPGLAPASIPHPGKQAADTAEGHSGQAVPERQPCRGAWAGRGASFRKGLASIAVRVTKGAARGPSVPAPRLLFGRVGRCHLGPGLHPHPAPSPGRAPWGPCWGPHVNRVSGRPGGEGGAWSKRQGCQFSSRPCSDSGGYGHVPPTSLLGGMSPGGPGIALSPKRTWPCLPMARPSGERMTALWVPVPKSACSQSVG